MAHEPGGACDGLSAARRTYERGAAGQWERETSSASQQRQQPGSGNWGTRSASQQSSDQTLYHILTVPVVQPFGQPFRDTIRCLGSGGL